MADRVEGPREIEGYDDDIWVGLEQTSDGALESKRLVMRLTKRRGEAYAERNDLVKPFGNLSLLTTVSDGQKTRSVLEPESVCLSVKHRYVCKLIAECERKKS